MRIHVQGKRLIDSAGREVLLHGVNMVCKDKSRAYIGDWGDGDFAKLKRWGMNVVRLGIIWDGLEPEPGSYADSYVEELRRLIRLAAKHELRVFLDMHQDLYSSSFGDGAPAWATVTDGETFAASEKWSDGYLFSSAVQNAFDHFWNNDAGPDGIGIQDRYVAAWRYVAEKLGGEPNVIGYDLMNEPFPGSDAIAATEAMFAAYARIVAERTGEPALSVAELQAAWLDPGANEAAIRWLEDPAVLRRVARAMAPSLQRFDRSMLSQMYRKAASAIRESDPDGILFLEADYFSNMGMPSAIEPVTDAAGKRDANQIYAPHAYDIVTDTDSAFTANDGRVTFIFDSHEETRDRLDMPMLVGEWGAYYGSDDSGHAAVHIQRLMERLLCGDAYWDYTPAMDRHSSFVGVCRGYPAAVAGRLLQYRYEPLFGSFQMSWDEDVRIGQPTQIYLPDIRHIRRESVFLSPPADSFKILKIEGSDAGLLEIPPTADGPRSLAITGRNRGERD